MEDQRETLDIMKVIWRDARGVTQDWETFDEIRETERNATCVMVSIGAVVCQTRTMIKIAGHVGLEPDDDHQACGVMAIPKASVISISRLCTLDVAEVRGLYQNEEGQDAQG